MRNIIIKIDEDGKNATIIYDELNNEGKITTINKRSSILDVYVFLQNVIFRNVGIIGKKVSNDITQLKLTNDEIVKIINLNNKNISKRIDDNILKTIKNKISEIVKIDKKDVNITETNGCIDFEILKESGYKKVIDILLPTDDSGNLTDLAKEILDYFLEEEFKDFNVFNTSLMFSSMDTNGILSAYHNSSKILAIGTVAKYIAPITKTYQNKYYDGGVINGKYYNG